MVHWGPRHFPGNRVRRECTVSESNGRDRAPPICGACPARCPLTISATTEEYGIWFGRNFVSNRAARATAREARCFAQYPILVLRTALTG